MEDVLFIGASKNFDIDVVLLDACVRLTQFGISAANNDLIAVENLSVGEARRVGGFLGEHFYVQLLFKNAASYVSIARFKTEIVPGYSVIKDPLTIGVSVWVGAEATHRLLAASIAAAIAANVGGEILDSEHKWVDSDLNCVHDFVDMVMKKFKAL